jgi:hypothetical protein
MDAREGCEICIDAGLFGRLLPDLDEREIAEGAGYLNLRLAVHCFYEPWGFLYAH